MRDSLRLQVQTEQEQRVVAETDLRALKQKCLGEQGGPELTSATDVVPRSVEESCETQAEDAE